MRTPNFDDLIGTDVPAAERERLRRVHELLVAAGPPAEVPPTLAEPPAPGRGQLLPMSVPPRRRVAMLIAAAVTAAAFGAGYLAGTRDDGGREIATPFPVADVVRLEPVRQDSDAIAVVQVGERRDDGNWTMVVTVEGLPHLPSGDYYELFMTKDGERVVTCGTFNARGGIKATTVRFNVAYNRDEYDGWSLVRYTSEGHKEQEILRA